MECLGAMTRYRPLLVLCILLVGCSQEPEIPDPDPCAQVKITLSYVNNTAIEQRLTYVIFGCVLEIGGEASGEVTLNANEQRVEEPAWFGANRLLIILREPGSAAELARQEILINVDNPAFTVTISENGGTYTLAIS